MTPIPFQALPSKSAASDPNVTVMNAHGNRILCLAEIRGQLSQLNNLAKKYEASCIIHSGNFGFFDSGSINRISPTYVLFCFYLDLVCLLTRHL